MTFRRYVLLAVAVVAASAVAVPPVSASVESPVRAGDVVIVTDDGREELDHGGSATGFTLRLPEGASCPGDSQNDQWRIQSFIVPATDDPGALQYELIGPAGGGVRYALYDQLDNPYMQQFTQPNTSPGQPGRVPAVAPLSFGVFPPGTIPAGTYRIGIACTYFRDTGTYWDTTIVVVDDASDAPSKFVWRLESAPASVLTSNDGADTGWWIAGGVALAILAALAWSMRHRRTPSRKPSELQESR